MAQIFFRDSNYESSVVFTHPDMRFERESSNGYQRKILSFQLPVEEITN